MVEEDSKRLIQSYPTTGVINVITVVKTHATEKGYTVRSVDMTYIMVDVMALCH